MIQIQYPQPFCNIHNDYLMEILRMDYLIDDCSRLCKICRKEQYNTEKIQEQRNNVEQIIEQLKNVSVDQLEISLKEKIGKFCKNLNDRLFNQMQELLGQFEQIRQEIIKKKNKEELEQYIDNSKQKVIDKIIDVKHNVIDAIYNSVEDVDEVLFLENLYNQQIENARIPPINHIVQNYDSYNLLLKLQVYLKQMSYLRQEDFERTCQLNVTSFTDELNSQEKRLKNLEVQLEDKMKEETNKLMMRFRRYKGFSKDNQSLVRDFISKMQNQGSLQIQEMNQNDLQTFTNYETAVKYFRQLQSEQRQSFSRLAHLGRIDIEISLEQIYSCFEFDFIPINAQQQSLYLPKLAFDNPIQEPIQRIKVNINERGQFDKDARFQLADGSQGTGEFKDGNLIQKQIQQRDKRKLLNLDLTILTKNNENTFLYSETKDSKQEKYEEKDKKWILTREIGESNREGLWILYVTQNIQVRNLKINSNQEVDQNQEVVFVIPENQKENIQKEYNYTGTINNSFQYQGRGRLILTERKKPVITKEGIWNKGKLEGWGKIYQNNEIFYEGNFIDGLRSGQGIEYFPQGYFYQGEFRDDKKHGSGVIRRKLKIDGKLEEMEIEKCNWQNDQPVISNCEIF